MIVMRQRSLIKSAPGSGVTNTIVVASCVTSWWGLN